MKKEAASIIGIPKDQWYTVKLQAKLNKVIQEKTELKTKLTEVSKQLKDKSASNEELEKRQSQMDEEKEDYRRKLAFAKQDKMKLEKDAKKLKAEH